MVNEYSSDEAKHRVKIKRLLRQKGVFLAHKMGNRLKGIEISDSDLNDLTTPTLELMLKETNE